MNTTISYTTLPEFEFVSPNTLKETLSLLNIHQSNAVVLAGGTDLLPELRHRIKQPKLIIDVKNIPELNELNLNDKFLTIGAAVPVTKVLTLPKLDSLFTALYQSLQNFCDEILRNRATIAGNIATSSPAADSAGPLLVFDAIIEIQSIKKGKCTVKIEDFFKGVKQNCLEPDELITKIRLPIPEEETKSAYLKMKRGVEDIALVGVTGASNRTKTLFAYTAVASTPILIDISAILSKNRNQTKEDLFQIIWKQIQAKIQPISDVRSGKDYRFHIAEIYTRIILREFLK